MGVNLVYWGGIIYVRMRFDLVDNGNDSCFVKDASCLEHVEIGQPF